MVGDDGGLVEKKLKKYPRYFGGLRMDETEPNTLVGTHAPRHPPYVIPSRPTRGQVEETGRTFFKDDEYHDGMYSIATRRKQKKLQSCKLWST